MEVTEYKEQEQQHAAKKEEEEEEEEEEEAPPYAEIDQYSPVTQTQTQTQAQAQGALLSERELVEAQILKSLFLNNKIHFVCKISSKVSFSKKKYISYAKSLQRGLLRIFCRAAVAGIGNYEPINHR